MKGTNRLVVTALFLFLVFTSSVMGETVTIKGGITDFRPFYVVEDTDKLSGEFYDMMVKILKKAGFKYTIKGYPPRRLYHQLASGVTDTFIGIKGSPIYEGKVLYSNIEATPIKLGIYGLPGTEMPKDINGLKGQKVLTIAGYGYGGYREKLLTNPEAKIELMDTFEHVNAFLMLRARRGGVKYLLNYERPSTIALKTVSIPGIQVVPVFHVKTYIIVSKKTKNAPEVLAKMEKAFNELKGAGEIMK